LRSLFALKDGKVQFDKNGSRVNIVAEVVATAAAN
jgi:ribosomal protein L27